jgi:hemoglobin
MNTAAITEDDIARIVPAFYARVRADPMLGPIFNGAIEDWPGHLGKLEAFWSSVMLTSGRYKGQPVPAHLRHADKITSAHFGRWLELWRETTDRELAPEGAAAMQEKAARIAESLGLSIRYHLDPRCGLRAAPHAN